MFAVVTTSFPVHIFQSSDSHRTSCHVWRKSILRSRLRDSSNSTLVKSPFCSRNWVPNLRCERERYEWWIRVLSLMKKNHHRSPPINLTQYIEQRGERKFNTTFYTTTTAIQHNVQKRNVNTKSVCVCVWFSTESGVTADPIQSSNHGFREPLSTKFITFWNSIQL